MKKLTTLTILLSTLIASDYCHAEEKILIDNFENGLQKNWKTKSFVGNTDYKVVPDETGHILRAESSASASGLIYNIKLNLKDYPIISWRWKIDGIVESGDSQKKSGDDYAARIYVIFPHWFFLKTKTLNYIWANRLPKESFQENAFMANAMMIAVESGPEKVGQWVSVQRNVLADYRRAFDEDPPDVGAIAIMTDTDNTGGKARAWFDDIYFSKKR